MTRRLRWHALRCRQAAIAEPVLILALSARALAQAAQAYGCAAHVIDHFGDEDTLACAASWQRLALDGQGKLNCTKLHAAVRTLRARLPQAPLLWGGGLESHPALLQALAHEGILLGSDLSGVARLLDLPELAMALRANGVPLPSTSRAFPRGQGWLCKEAGGAGGAHVREVNEEIPTGGGSYFQRRVEGHAHSVTLLATVAGVQVLGWNRLLRDDFMAGRSFAWQGAITTSDLAPDVQECIEHAATRIANELGWRGLCGLDFMLPPDGGTPQIIDLNPRPTATFPLHTKAEDALRLHLEACRGVVPHSEPKLCSTLRGLRVLYAAHPLCIPNSLDWPNWISDRPPRGSHIRAGEPICTVQASGSSHAEVLTTLQSRVHELMERLGSPQQ